ncbi:MAG: 6-phosphofructokinase [Chloroflexi bacterium]|nr:6-phosphofructokinase [Chloroflexota bacterium]
MCGFRRLAGEVTTVEGHKRIGVMTGGGDCPGLNAAIRATAKTAILASYEVIGIRDGWQGLIDHDNLILDQARTSEILDRGGTILGTSRFSPLKVEGAPEQVLRAFADLGLSGLVVLGGNGTLSVASKMFDMGLPVVGIPKTIDNDVAETEFAIGFQTAVQIATDALDRLRSTAESHHRVMLLEVMGRDAGWIAVYAGMASGADAILIPEIPVDEDRMEKICEMVGTRSGKGKKYSIVVVAEGARLTGFTSSAMNVDCAGGQPSAHRIGEVVAQMVQERTGVETRHSSLDYIQRGGSPTAYDRNLATAFGARATELVRKRDFGKMVALKGNGVVTVPLGQIADRIRTVDRDMYDLAAKFFS